MARWEVEVSEIIHHRVMYEVEADTEAEAVARAAIGETVKETILKNEGVMDRHIEGDPVCLGVVSFSSGTIVEEEKAGPEEWEPQVGDLVWYRGIYAKDFSVRGKIEEKLTPALFGVRLENSNFVQAYPGQMIRRVLQRCKTSPQETGE